MEHSHKKTDKGDFNIAFVLSFASADEFSKSNLFMLPDMDNKEAEKYLKSVYNSCKPKEAEPKKAKKK